MQYNLLKLYIIKPSVQLDISPVWLQKQSEFNWLNFKILYEADLNWCISLALHVLSSSMFQSMTAFGTKLRWHYPVWHLICCRQRACEIDASRVSLVGTNAFGMEAFSGWSWLAWIFYSMQTLLTLRRWPRSHAAPHVLEFINFASSQPCYMDRNKIISHCQQCLNKKFVTIEDAEYHLVRVPSCYKRFCCGLLYLESSRRRRVVTLCL